MLAKFLFTMIGINWKKYIKCCLEMSPAKRKDPNYIQLNTDVRKEIGLKFKATCTLKQISLGEGLEQAIALWLEQQNQEGVV